MYERANIRTLSSVRGVRVRVSEGEGGARTPNERASRANAYMQMNVLRVARGPRNNTTPPQRTGTPREHRHPTSVRALVPEYTLIHTH
ncbi:unnamed protein product, partial [Strongylus vulgaris]